MTKTIEITVDPKGGTTVETKGFVGGECREASRFVEVALGRAVAETLTAEFHVDRHAANDLTQRS